ncbi:MAG: hypothetical protein RR951_05490 [Ruthenibacterium sp.]
MKKNSFLTFCFACIPGAGEMYLGYMKRGISLMLLFFGIIGIATMLRFDVLLMILPVIFAFCFFDTWNLRNQTQEQAEARPDDYLVDIGDFGSGKWKELVEKRHVIIGWGCIIVAIVMLYNSVVRPIVWFVLGDDSWMYNVVFDSIPMLGAVVLLVLLGLYLLRGPRATQQNPPQDDYVAYTGTGEEIGDEKK